MGLSILKGKTELAKEEQAAEMTRRGQMAGIRMDLAVRLLCAKLGATGGARLGEEQDVKSAFASADMILKAAGIGRMPNEEGRE